VPFLGVDAQGEVDLDVLDAADVAGDFPGKLLVRVPGFAHREESRVSHGLGVGGDAVVFTSGEVVVFGAEAGEDMLDFFKVLLGCAVFDEDLRNFR
jgi:hypothetical protein